MGKDKTERREKGKAAPSDTALAVGAKSSGEPAELFEERANERARSELELARLSLERSQGH